MTRLSRILCLVFLAAWTLRAQTPELRVVIGTPQGATSSIDQSFRVIAAFSEPVSALTTVPEGTGSGPLVLAPGVKGAYRWLGTTTLAFTPSDTLPFATRFTATVPAGTRALSGALLKEAYVWSFETPRPLVVRTQPASGQTHVEPDHAITLTFNQPIDLNTIGRWISLEERADLYSDATYPSYTLRVPTDEEISIRDYGRPIDLQSRTQQEQSRLDRERARTVVLVPSLPFKKGSSIRVVCKAGLQAKEGPLGMPSEFVSGFSIYGDLKFVGIRSDNNFHPAYSLRIEFSNPVSFAELARHISLTPEAKIKQSFDDDYSTDNHYVSFDLKPETQYKGVITAGLKDQFGNVLAADAPFTFRTSSYPPSVSMTTGPGLLEAYEAHRIPVVFLNCDSAGLLMGALQPDQVIPLLAGTDFWGNEEWTAALLKRVPKERRVERIWKISDLVRNKSVVRPIELDEVLGAQKKGIAFVQLKHFDKDYPRIMKTMVQVTDIGLTAKFSPESVLIWATKLVDASAVADAEIELRTDSNRVVWRGWTDASGTARAPGWGALGIQPLREYYGQNDEYESTRPPRLWVIVKHQGDCAFTSSQWNEGIEPYSFAIEADWNPQPEKYEAVLFTDRGLYKANETVSLKSIVRVRKEGAWQIPDKTRLRLTITDPRGEEVMKRDVSVNQYGSFSLSHPVKVSAPTGYYRMMLQVRSGSSKGKDRWSQIANGEFRVEAFRVAEFEVRSKLERESYVIGDTARGFLSAQYLFGAPLKKAPLKWRFSVSPAYFVPPGYEAYSFGAIDWLSEYSDASSSRRMLSSGEAVLDEFGSASMSCALSKTAVKGTVTLMLEGDATSVSRQTLSGRSSVIVHAGEYYVGVKPSTTFLSADSSLTISLVTVTKDGTVLPSRDVTLRIYRRIWHSVRKAETGGHYAWQTEVVDSLVDSVSVTTAEMPRVHRYTPGDAGFYYISARSIDERGNEIETQSTFYVSGSGYVAWARSDDDKIELVSDRANYAPGDEAVILVKNPYERATALVSIEREGILSHYTTILEGSAPRIRVPIAHAYLPNVFVSVVLLQGRIERPSDSQEADIGRPSFKVGYVKLSVSPVENKLRVSVETSRKEYRPGDTVRAVITVRTAQGMRTKAELAVSAADQGVLSLIGYHLPDPFDVFYRERGLAVVTTETRLHLVKQRNYGEKGEDAGGGGASMKAAAELDAEGIRKDFRASAYWNPSLVTDDSGRVTISFKLPDNLTAFKLMAVAQTAKSEFGEGEATFSVSKPLLLQPSLPRLARVGDRFDAGVVVVNYTSETRRVAVGAKAAGIGFGAKDTTVIELAPGQAREVTYAFNADKLGTAVVTIKAQSGSDDDGLRWSFPVVAPRVTETTALFNSSANPRREEALFIPESVFPNEGEVEVTAASSALVGLSGGMAYLFSYPYGCLEQKASRVLPVILAGDLVEAFKFEVFKRGDYKEIAQKTIDEFALFQKFSGGFSYWKTDEVATPYISAYAVYALLEAKQHGYRVDARALENGLAYLTRVLSGEEPGMLYSIEASQCTRALIVYTLARAGRTDYGAIDKLFRERATLPLFAKAYVMRAAALANQSSPIVTELARDLTNRVKIDATGASFEEPSENGLWWIFHSNTRTTAIILLALVESNKDADLSSKIVRRLLNVQRNGCWRTTQENLFVVASLAAYFKKYEHEEPNFRAEIALDGKKILEELFKGRSLETKKAREPIAAIAKGKNVRITLDKDGAGRLYYGIRLKYVPRSAETQRSEGITLVRTMEPVEATSTKEIRSGQMMKVTVSVIAHQDRQFVAVEDPVPAGFEIVATNFATSASNLSESGDGDFYNVFNHTERYDDRLALFADRMPAGIHSYTYLVRAIHAGMYIQPSTRAECMYEPEIFARTESGTVTVR